MRFVKFYSAHITLHILILICDFYYNLQKTT